MCIRDRLLYAAAAAAVSAVLTAPTAAFVVEHLELLLLLPPRSRDEWLQYGVSQHQLRGGNTRDTPQLSWLPYALVDRGWVRADSG